VIFVPIPLLSSFNKIQQRYIHTDWDCRLTVGRLTRELEKKFSDRHVVFIGQRRIMRKPGRNSRQKQPRPMSRTLTAVHDKILEDLVFPTEIVGKRVRVRPDGVKIIKVYLPFTVPPFLPGLLVRFLTSRFLDSKDSSSLDYKLDSFSSVYNKLTGKTVVFEFPVQPGEGL
jgi:small subunit ribosomal protein S7e